ncbi:MAG: type II secretion system protein J [Nitrospirota bacterium]|jgi:general secretion pathway protein J|nr:prepilin-type N-terminal cleavage/methylation domain-containing protein [Burkholderiaceae bacterium]
MALAPHSFHTHRPAQAARGFTLVELLVAMAIMGLMALLSWRGLDGMVRAQEQTRQRGDQLLVLQAALTQWGADLDALLPLPHTTPLDWDGQVLRITRRSSAIPDEGALVVAWARRNVDGTSQWLRWQSPPLRTRSAWQQAWQQAAQWARNPGDAERRAEVALLPLADWQVFYFRGDAWSNPMSSSGTPPGDLDAVGALIPDGVRLQLDLPPGPGMAGQITRDWVSPLKGGGKT